MMLTKDVLSQIWLDANLPVDALATLRLPDCAALLSSSFLIGVAAQSSIAAAALAASEIWMRRTGQRQEVSITKHDAELECTGYFTIDGTVPGAWARLSGIYPCGNGYIRIHANFDHHRDGILAILDLPAGDQTDKATVQRALENWDAGAFESAAADKGLVVAKVRSFKEWDQHPQQQITTRLPLVTFEKISASKPVALAAMKTSSAPLTNIRVLDLTRILAGPVCGRTLANYGADVMLVNSPRLPNIEAIIDTSRGKRSTLLDLQQHDQRQSLQQLIQGADILVQGYRPGGLDNLGFGAEELAQSRPGLIYVSLTAYGHIGPWSSRRGFDSLVQTATGFNHAEALAADSVTPKALPVQILDYASGFLMAFGAQAALLKRAEEGGSWHVRVSLLQTAQWLRSLGRTAYTRPPSKLDLKQYLQAYPCNHGELRSMPHGAKFSRVPTQTVLPSVSPGTNPPVW